MTGTIAVTYSLTSGAPNSDAYCHHLFPPPAPRDAETGEPPGLEERGQTMRLARCDGEIPGAGIAGWVEAWAEEILGEFTGNVPLLLARTHANYRWREDRVQCMRSRVEYRLNMVGAEIKNRAFRSDFQAAEERAALVPCACGRPEGECAAANVPKGLCCPGCEPACSLNRLRALGEKSALHVRIIPLASVLSRWSPAPGRPRFGVVAATCVNTRRGRMGVEARAFVNGGGWPARARNSPRLCGLFHGRHRGHTDE